MNLKPGSEAQVAEDGLILFEDEEYMTPQ